MTDVREPCTAVEFTILRLDLVLDCGVRRGLHKKDVDALDWLRTWKRPVPDENSVASVPNVEDVKSHVRLSSLAADEGCLGGKGQCAELMQNSRQ